MNGSLLRRLRLLGLAEGVTLLLLLFIAVPLKHFAALPQATAIMGPVHGLVFLAYAVTLVESITAGGWTRRDAWMAGIACLVPFGPLFSDRRIQALIGAARARRR
jgi:integral membrane protein